MKLENKVALITGSSRGIGRATALTLAKEGANVVVNYSKSKDQAEEVLDKIIKMGRKAIVVKADVSKKEEVFNMVNRAFNEFGKIDILVNNAGSAVNSPSYLEATKDDWDYAMGINVYGAYYCVQAVAPKMIERKYGKIINISSITSLGTPGKISSNSVSYAPSKAALNVLTKRLSYVLGPHNINVNAIAPGMIITETMKMRMNNQEGFNKALEDIQSATSLRRYGEPQDIANLVLFLASDESNFITGQLILCDGGRFDYLSHSI